MTGAALGSGLCLLCFSADVGHSGFPPISGVAEAKFWAFVVFCELL